MGDTEGSSGGDGASHLLDPSKLDPFAVDELNRRGPKYGVVLPQTAASVILSRLGEELESYRVSTLGYNNRLYFVTTKSGREYVMKICGRYWKRAKTETEVVGLFLASKPSSIPAPKIVAWDSKGEEFGVEYTVMRKLEGARLVDVWKTLSFEKKRSVVTQIAELVVSYKKPSGTAIPQGRVGNFMIRGGDRRQSGEMESIDFDVGATLEGLGPWPSYKAYLKTQLEVKIESVRKDPRMKAMKELLPMVEALIETLETDDDEIADSAQFVFTHGDLTLENLLVTFIDDVPKITAVLDWEWSGMFPAEEEFFCSFDFILEKTADDGIGDEFEQLQEHFFTVLEEGGVETPRTLPYYWQRKYLYDLRENLFPWHITDCDDVDKVVEQAVVDVRKLLLKLRR